MSLIKELKNLGQDFKILYVEDEASLRESVHTYLKKIFTFVDVAKNGMEGLELYKNNKYDIIISDILMPEMNGLEMSKEIKKINEEQEIIIISAYSESSYFLEAIELGVNGYIIKPINYNQFISTLFKSVQKLARFKENILYKEHLEELVKERTAKLIEAEEKKTENFKQTLLALVEMIEDRDRYTAGHSQRVAQYCKLIAYELGYSDDECELIYQAGVLHDIGKVATPDTVLLKPGKLSTLEYKLIQEHVAVGYDLLHKVSMYEKLSEIMRYHHERYDGKGYPNGLYKEQIPQLAHIMIVADAFDAMTTSRIYKSRKTIKEAVDEIENLSGQQFDPEVAKVAISVFKNIHQIESTSQLPITQLEQERFSYFYRDQTTSGYNIEYLDFMLNHNLEEKKYDKIDVLYLHNLSVYNDTYGWSKGDELLYELVMELNKQFGDVLIFRIHGNDFIIISESELNIELDSLNKLALIQDNKLFFTHQSISLILENIFDIKSLEGLLNEHK